MKISQDQLLVEGNYANVKMQSLYDDHTLALSHTIALTAWDRIKEVGKKIELFLKLYRVQRKPSQITYFSNK